MKSNLTLVISAVVILCTATLASPGGGSFDITLKPVPNETDKVARVDVSQRIDGVPGKPLVLMAAIDAANTLGIADRITNLEASDTGGTVTFSTEQDQPAKNGEAAYRRWTATRSVVWPVTVQYQAGMQPDNGPSGPPYGVRTAGSLHCLPINRA